MAPDGPAFASTPRSRAFRIVLGIVSLVGLAYATVVVLGLLDGGDREALGLPGRHSESGQVTNLGPVSVEAERKALRSTSSGSPSPSPSNTPATPSAAPPAGASDPSAAPPDEAAAAEPPAAAPSSSAPTPETSASPTDDGALLDADVNVLDLLDIGISI
ncbi:hypothetical protein [Cryptosporangium aurantiacum]|uniref:Uncharacterized protein n=1 Tax=Cryptosporangium aurantiacum TaxID=134849 RepID=A0A1M7RMT1_9ACTN|nr:hypothetical protein [Cryptosporangium aurantiacum]SHN47613.1 hypothetical protein SAMN05443668_12573 [Cryptosporangium aurantiacum]